MAFGRLRLTSVELDSLSSLVACASPEQLEEIENLLSPPTIPFCPHQPTPTQARFLESESLESLYGGAAGGGKSDAILMGALQYASKPRYSALIVRRTYADLAKPDSLIPRSKDWLMGRAEWNEQRHAWTFPSGAVLQFGYLDGPNDRYQYQSSAYQYIGFDELTQFREEDYLYLFSRLRRNADQRDIPLRMRSASNPGGVGHDWVRARFVDPKTACAEFIPARLRDNPYIDANTYIESLNRLPPSERARLLDGDWDAGDDSLVTHADMLACTARSLPPSGYPRYIGFDVGRSRDLSVIWTWSRVGDVAHCVECHVMRDASYDEQEDALRARITRDVVRVGIDAGGIGSQLAERMRREFPAVVEGVHLSADRMGQMGLLLATACEERRIRIPDDPEIREDWRKVRKVEVSTDRPRLATDRDRSGHGDRFWAAAIGYWLLTWTHRTPRIGRPSAFVPRLGGGVAPNRSAGGAAAVVVR